MKTLMLIGLGIALGTSAALAQDEDAIQRLAQEAFAPVIAEYDIPGLAVGVSIDGVTHIFTQGVAQRSPEIPVTADTLFELGSVSKLFNVTLAALAEQDGRLSLEDPVSRQLPALAGSAFDRITLYDLAAHANGGLPLQVPDAIVTDADLTEWLAAWNPPTDPATIRAYSNLSIGLLGRIAAKSYDSAYAPALRDRVLAPLGLGDTFIDVPEAAMPRYAFGYSRDDDSAIRVTPGMLDNEAYGVKSSITDMMRFVDAHLGNLDLDPGMEAALSRTREDRYDTAHYAQAMIWEEYPWPVDPAQLQAGNGSEMALKPQPIESRTAPMTGPMLLNKTGATNGFGAYVAMVPQERIGVVVLANRNYPNTVRAETTAALIEAILRANRP